MPTDGLILIGAGGHGKVVFDALQLSGLHNCIEVRDDSPSAKSVFFGGIAVVAPAIPVVLNADAVFHIAIGMNTTRQLFGEELQSQGVQLANIVHSDATVSPHSIVGEGVFIAARAVVAPAAVIGTGVIINHASVVDHDCMIGAWSHIAPGAVLCGGVTIGAGVLIGAGATILPGVHIGDRACIGAGSVVTRNVPVKAVVTGVPGKVNSKRGS